MNTLPESATPDQPESTDNGNSIYTDMLSDARDSSTDFLLERAEVYALEAADDDPDFPGPVGQYLARERLRAIQTELDRRTRILHLDAGQRHQQGKHHAAWTDLARVVRERVDIVEVFVLSGYQLHDTGPTEAHAACIVCGGEDRLVIRRDPPGRCWCRRCGWRGDMITLTMYLRQCDFRDAVKWLAELAGTEEAPE